MASREDIALYAQQLLWARSERAEEGRYLASTLIG